MKETLALVATVGALLCGFGSCALPSSAVTPPDCRMADDLARRLTSYLAAAERARLGLKPGLAQREDDDEVAIELDRCPVATSMGRAFFRGYNATLDPAWIYVVAVDEGGGISRVQGFPDTQFAEITKVWLANSPPVTKASALEIAKTYFALVERWHPGVVDSNVDLSLAREASAAQTTNQERRRSSCRPELPLVSVSAGSATLRLTLFDAEATRLECAEVEVSAERGLAVLKREVLLDGLRFEL